MNKKTYSNCLNDIGLDTKLFRPRLFNMDYYNLAPPIDMNNAYNENMVKIYYDLKSNTHMNDLESLPSNEFTLDDSYTFKQLLLDAAKFWKISHGAVESKSVLFVNREGKEWDLTGKVLYILRFFY